MRVAFVGLGAMGAGIVLRLLAAGNTVTGWNRTRARAEPLAGAGMQVAGTPREAAASAEVVFSMLTDAPAVESVLTGEDGILAGLGRGAIYLDMSTIAPDRSRAFARRVADIGATMLDAPVSGSPATLAQGQLAILVGGDEAAFERVRPLLLDIGPKVIRIGENGHALLMKLAINLSLVVQVVSFCESVALAEKGGIAREVAVEAMLKSVVGSPVLGYRGPFILEGKMPDVAWADVDLQQKDMLLSLELARTLGAAAPIGAAANELLNSCRGVGLAERDFAIVYEVYRRLDGMA
ncbi:MAG: NAD(P)-dependent oxidoreductase [Actinomycetota bacterium]|nr:NAD(P)-dependent oxidoreductase [Actinomycetota bacterium]